MFKKFFVGTLITMFTVGALGIPAAMGGPWDDAFDAASGERFIPIELWTGMAWDGSRTVSMTKAIPSARRRVQISGPEDYTRPTTGESLRVYRRVNRGKVQLFAVTSGKDGLGRVYDSRYNRNCIDEVKFPLGIWRAGEVRDYTVDCERQRRRLRVRIEEIDFTYRGRAHSLRFRWTVDGGTRRGQDNSYVYSPGEGLVQVIEHVK